MSNSVYIKLSDGPIYHWLTISDGARRPDSGDATRLRQACAAGQAILLAAAEFVTLRNVEFEASERKLLTKTLPYSLEDELSSDVDELHFALGPVAENQVPVAIVDRVLIEQWLADFRELDIEVAAIIPEQLALPVAEGHWTLAKLEDGFLVRYGEFNACYLDANLYELGVQTLLNEQQQAPEQLTLYALEQDQQEVIARLPDLLRANVVTKQEDYWGWIATDLNESTLINLRQGEFARSLPWGKWWLQWRVAAMVAAIAIVLGWGTAWFKVNDLETENLAIRQQTEQAYRQAIPKGRIVDAERQLRRQVNALKGQSGEGFSQLFESIAQVLGQTPGVELQAMTYSENQSEIRLTLIGGSFNEIETVRANIEKQSLTAELTGSSNEGGKTRARLRVEG